MIPEILQCRYRRGLSIAEVLAAMIIGSLVITSLVSIYGRAQKSREQIETRLSGDQMAYNVLQYIVEDISEAVGDDTFEFAVRNKIGSGGYNISQLEISRKIYANKDTRRLSKGRYQKDDFEKVTWQSRYEPDWGLILYRQREGMVPEDKMFDEGKEQSEREQFVPVCWGMTHFMVQTVRVLSDAPEGTLMPEIAYGDRWTGKESDPAGLALSISFAEPEETVDGTYQVREDQILRRTFILDRLKLKRFKLPRPEDEQLQ